MELLKKQLKGVYHCMTAGDIIIHQLLDSLQTKYRTYCYGFGHSHFFVYSLTVHHKQVYATSRADAFYELEREQGVNKMGHKHAVAISFTNQDT